MKNNVLEKQWALVYPVFVSQICTETEYKCQIFNSSTFLKGIMRIVLVNVRGKDKLSLSYISD